MGFSLPQYTADHRYLLEAAARQAGFADPVAVSLDAYSRPLLKAARKGRLLPVDGALIRDWGPYNRQEKTGIAIGARLFEIQGIRFVRVCASYHEKLECRGLDFLAVDRKDYRRLYRMAVRCRRESAPSAPAPILASGLTDLLWKNTIGYLDPRNLRRIRALGGRPKRGILLLGGPGNGKTSACRWIWEACRQRNWEWRLVTPDSYRLAREYDSVNDLFSFERRGVVFFDDMDLALRDRETIKETEDQAVLLSALDGIEVKEGVVFVFTSNCAPGLIDRAFRRPGRLDLVLHFELPDARLRRQLLDRWSQEIRNGIDLDHAVTSTDGYSFAEIEELKNLLILHHLEANLWDWTWALEQFDLNRRELSLENRRRVGFATSPDEELVTTVAK